MAEPLLDRSKISIKRDDYGTASYTNLLDQGLISQAREFKRALSGRMYPLDKEGISRKIANSDYHVSRKVDGEFNLFFHLNEECFTLNPGGTVRTGMPWMREASELLKAAGLSQATFAGELYFRKPGGERSRVHDIVSVARNPRSTDELNQVAFAVFDLINIDGQLADLEEFETNWRKIKTYVTGDRFHPVESQMAGTATEVKRLFEKWVDEERAEGLVVRGDAGGFFKVKPRHTIDAVILGFTESTGDREGMLHDILVGLKRSDGALQALTKVGGGFTDDQRRELLSDLRDNLVGSEYAEVNSDHVAYQMVRPEKVIELSFLDLVAETTRGGPVNRMVLDFDGEYRVIRRFPLASVISPQFVRFRDDKTVDPKDVGIEQISKLVNVENFDQNAKELKFPKSEILSRSVFQKDAKGSKMVRKFVIFKTNKENQSDDFPAFVFHYTDFSPNRKTPLAREVRVSSSLAQITAIRDQFLKENIKKGWEEVAGSADEAAIKIAAASVEGGETGLKSETIKRKTASKKVPKKKTAKKKASNTQQETESPSSPTKKPQKKTKKSTSRKKKS